MHTNRSFQKGIFKEKTLTSNNQLKDLNQTNNIKHEIQTQNYQILESKEKKQKLLVNSLIIYSGGALGINDRRGSRGGEELRERRRPKRRSKATILASDTRSFEKRRDLRIRRKARPFHQQPSEQKPRWRWRGRERHERELEPPVRKGAASLESLVLLMIFVYHRWIEKREWWTVDVCSRLFQKISD